MAALSEDDFAIILCMRVNDGPPAVPSEQRSCHLCGAAVWVDPVSTEAYMHRYPEHEMVFQCGTCTFEGDAEHQPTVEQLIQAMRDFPPEARRNLREHGHE